MNVYKIENKINNKKYIGITKFNILERFETHIKNGKATKLTLAFLKFGIKNFEISLVESNLTIEQAILREKYWIKYYNSFKDGYNSSKGGEHPQKKILKMYNFIKFNERTSLWDVEFSFGKRRVILRGFLLKENAAEMADFLNMKTIKNLDKINFKKKNYFGKCYEPPTVFDRRERVLNKKTA